MERYMPIRSLTLFAVVAFVACDKKTEAPTPPPAAVAPQAANTNAAAAPAEKPAAKNDQGYVLYSTVLKREGSDKPKVDDGKGKQVTNWLATLYRGERVTIGKEEGDYIQAKTSGEVDGWVKKTSLLISPDVTEATVLEASDAFDRPDLLALNSKKKINPGTLLFVVKNRDQFSEVNAAGGSTVWVLNGRISTDANEIAVAKLLAKARSMKDAKGDGAAELINLAKTNFGSAKLVAVMETELNGPAGASGAAEAPAQEQAAGDAKPEAKPQ
jgi:hypothetical protein